MDSNASPAVRCFRLCQWAAVRAHVRAVCSALLVAGMLALPCGAYSAPLDPLESAAQSTQWVQLKTLAEDASKDASLSAAEHGQAYEYLALAYINLELPGEAMDAADQAVHLAPQSARGWLMRGTAYMMLRQLASAEEDFNRALQVDPKAWEACRNLAELAQARGDLPTALDWFEKSVTLAPGNVDLGMEYALLLHSFGLHAKAEKAFSDVIAVAPQAPGPYNNRGMVRLALDHYDEALSDFSQAIILNPSYEEALINRGNVLRAFKRYAESLADFTTGLTSNPNSVKLLVGRAYTQAEMGNYGAAAADMGAAYKLGNIDPYVLNEYAWFLATCPDAGVRNGQRAIQLANEAIGLSAGPIPGYYDTLAAAYAEAGDYEKAVEVQKEALFYGTQAGLSDKQMQEWTIRAAGYEQGVPYRNIPQ